MKILNAYVIPGIPKVKKESLDAVYSKYCDLVIDRYIRINHIGDNNKARLILLTQKLISSKKRIAGLVYLRYMFMYYLKHERDYYSLVSIGNVLGGRHHTTVMSGVQEFRTMLDANYTPKDLTASEGAKKDYEELLILLQK